MALGTEHAICRIIEADGEPVGYAHAVDATLWGDTLPDELEPGTWDLDLFVAAEEHRAATHVAPPVALVPASPSSVSSSSLTGLGVRSIATTRLAVASRRPVSSLAVTVIRIACG